MCQCVQNCRGCHCTSDSQDPGDLPLDRVGGSVERSEWLLLVARGAWLWCHQISVCGAAVIHPGAVRIEYKRRAGSSSLDAAPVTGSLLYYAPVCRLAVCHAAVFSSWELFGGSDCIWLAVFGLFYRRVCFV